jgi:uncharacterized membrane protein/thiol-disulfide isomerase/thioredoxin
MKNKVVETIYKFLQVLGYDRISFRQIEINILSHPDSGSLNSITDTLTRLEVPSAALKAHIDSLLTLDEPFLALLNYHEGYDFYLVNIDNTKKPKIFSVKKKWIEISLEEFKNIYADTIVISETNEKKTSKTIKVPSLFFPGLLILCLLTLGYYTFVDLTQFIFYILSFIGLYIATTTYLYQFRNDAGIFNKFCKSGGKNSCEDVISSEYSKISENVSFSDLAIVFFVFQITFLLISSNNPDVLRGLYFLCLFTVPVTIYSVYLQKFIIKSWCLMCISLIVVLYIQILISINFFLKSNLSFSSGSLLYIPTVALAAVALWFVIRPSIKKIYSYDFLEIAYFRFKLNYNLFISSLLNENSIVTKNLPTHLIQINSGESVVTFTLITNPGCTHCKKALAILSKLLSEYKDKIKLNIIFNLSLNDKADISVLNAIKMLDAFKKDPQQGIEFIKDYHSIIKKANNFDFSISNESFDFYFNILIEHKEWCTKNDIDITPKLLIDNKHFPSIYEISDLPYFIDELLNKNNSQALSFDYNFITFQANQF